MGKTGNCTPGAAVGQEGLPTAACEAYEGVETSFQCQEPEVQCSCNQGEKGEKRNVRSSKGAKKKT